MSADDAYKIALVSNRGPVSFVQRDSGFELRRGAGGLAGALDPVAARLHDRAVWIAAAISEGDRAAVAAGEVSSLREELGYPVRMLDIDPEMYARYYDVVSNRMLWFANHCLWDELEIREFGPKEIAAWNDSYLPVNERFAEEVADLGDPSWLVLFQDYHLAMAPRFLRARNPEQTIFHFTHSSFCGPQGLGRLPDPMARDVIAGMLGADLVGFHVTPWVEGFADACRMIGADVDDEGVVTYEGRRSWIREYPIPIDAPELRRRAGDDAASRWAEKFLGHSDGPLIVRADRMEPSKNIIRGFEAFGRLLDRRRDLRDARFIACLYPSRQSMPEYQRYAQGIEAAVEAVNERHPGSILLFTNDDFDRTLGALRVYDVLLVNPIMDGMNLVAKEGSALNERDGVLILSSGAGAFEELGAGSITIDDALDIDATAVAIEEALAMNLDERRKRAESLREIVESRTPAMWIEAQLTDLQRVRDGVAPTTPYRS
ncbi:MAG TPA: trehalose-6-phosphate synthase [Actinomycetota bacterium]|nr:trehalose-6-phosphate synthase [Actinomycetota bacterium]